MYKVGLEKRRSQRSNCQHSLDHRKSMGISRNFCFITYAETFDCMEQNNLWKILKVMGIPDHLTCLLRNLYAGQEATVRTGNGTMDWFQIGKGVCQDCILSFCLSSMQSTWCEMPGWMKHKLELRLLGEISIISDTQMIPPLWHKAKKN